jgi:hypothetical protein
MSEQNEMKFHIQDMKPRFSPEDATGYGGYDRVQEKSLKLKLNLRR